MTSPATLSRCSRIAAAVMSRDQTTFPPAFRISYRKLASGAAWSGIEAGQTMTTRPCFESIR